MRFVGLLWKVMSLACLVVACGDEASDPAGASGEVLGFETGPEMLPGDNCRSCHGAPASRYPDAPAWSFAGTVFTGPSSEQGESNVIVTVIDATGAQVTAVTNDVGNFYTATPIVAPYSVSLQKGSRSITMAVPPPAGGCNACHSLRPVGGAPGRLYLPVDEFVSAAECDSEQTVTVGEGNYDCAPYACRMDPDECLRECADASDCASGFVCEAPRCVAKP